MDRRAGRGFGMQQPGGWAFNTLPYIEQEALHKLGEGLTGQALLDAGRKRLQTPLAVHYCPSRRRAALYPYPHDEVVLPTEYYVLSKGDLIAKNDYAVNVGDTVVNWSPVPTTLAQGDDPKFSWPDNSQVTGISFIRSQITIADIRDGTSNTYMLGEKSLQADAYTVGLCCGDDQTVYMAQNSDTMRYTAPSFGAYQQDRPGYNNIYIFGSAHPAGGNFAFCDGSVRTISYGIDVEVHRRLGNRRDGLPIDRSQLP